MSVGIHELILEDYQYLYSLFCKIRAYKPLIGLLFKGQKKAGVAAPAWYLNQL